jgi:FKBP-type peptidyl-prolyl cis-trans isomerase
MAHRYRPGTRWNQWVTRLPRVTSMRIAGKVTMVSVALVAAAALSACANSEQASTGTPNRNSTPPPLPITTTATSTSAATPTSATGNQPAAGECKADDVKVDGDFGAKPTITIPTTCKPPSTLITKDLKPGTGAEIKNGSVLTANYLLQTWSDKQVVDTSFGKQPFDVEGIGTGQVIKGWDQGLLGMKEGGRRLLIVPPALGYPNGSGPIKAGETLVFVTDAVKVTG